MRVDSVSPGSSIVASQGSDLQDRLDEIKAIAGRARSQGLDEFSVIMKDNDLDLQTIERLKNLYDISVQASDSLRVTIRFK